MKKINTVCILTAGKGARMGDLGLKLNKALHPVNGKAIISHIIEKFPADTEFVIGLGYFAIQVKQYLEIAHPNQNFIYTLIDNYEDLGSGPGYSLLCCQKHLQKPFYFVSCDTLWSNDLNWSINDNWIGIAPISPVESPNYCNVKVIDGRIDELRDKLYVEDSAFQAFVGLCFIKDYSIFWTALSSKEIISGEHQISNGIKALINTTAIFSQVVDWTDVGDEIKYKKVVGRYENYDFSKKNEALYILNDKVIKFFTDEKITLSRVNKTKFNPIVFPNITDHLGQFYAYKFQNGKTLYQANNPKIFRKFLDWLDINLWKNYIVDDEVMHLACSRFYQEKTKERLEMYSKKYPLDKDILIINGKNVPSVTDLLTGVPWGMLNDGLAYFIHGDLQFDNILYDLKADKFTLLDWRQDFSGNIEFGDLYYDFAKLYGGIILNYDYIKLNLLSYSESKDGIFFDFAERHQSNIYLSILTDYLSSKNYSLVKVEILVALIYLNMSPLHHYPFDKMLHAFGRELLHKANLKLQLPGSNDCS